MSWIIEKNTGSRKREGWVDGLRAVAVLFVIFGHQIPGNTIYYVFTSPIKIPLLLILLIIQVIFFRFSFYIPSIDKVEGIQRCVDFGSIWDDTTNKCIEQK